MKYHVYINNCKQGPYSLEELNNKDIKADTLIWCEGFSDWKCAKELPELSHIIYKTPPDPKQTSYQPMPKNWFVEALLVTIFCCIPFGVIGILEANKVEPLYRQGLYEDAMHHSKLAKKWTLWGFFTMLGFCILYAIFWIIFFVFVAAAASGSSTLDI